MPKSVKLAYKQWIATKPESWHPTSLNFFYFFLHKLLFVSKEIRTREWLEENIKKDLPSLSEDDITKYGEIFYHIRNFKNASKTHTAKLIAQSYHEKSMEKARKKFI